jgi:hypothetical protein
MLIGSQYVMKSTNSGPSWQQISPHLRYNDAATTGDSRSPTWSRRTPQASNRLVQSHGLAAINCSAVQRPVSVKR